MTTILYNDLCTSCRHLLRLPRKMYLPRFYNSSSTPPSAPKQAISTENAHDDLLPSSALITPTSSVRPVTTTAPSPPPSREERARLIFSSRLVGPIHQRSSGGSSDAGSLAAKPTEPDNCCMSGCVNCVWDGYREDLEAWQAARSKMEHDESRKNLGTELWAGVPVGIREFVRMEKRLKEGRAERMADHVIAEGGRAEG